MLARWGTLPTEAAQAFAGESLALPARALADPKMQGLRAKARDRIVVLRRSELRSLGVRSWVDVVQAVTATGAKALLVVSTDEELAALGLPANFPRHVAENFLPTAMLRGTAGEEFIAALGRGPILLRAAGKVEHAQARAEELTAAAKHAEAADVLAEALAEIDAGPVAVALRILRADALRLAGRPEDAVVEARAAVDIDPESSDGWVAVCQAHRAAGQTEAAKKAAEQALDIYEVQDERLTTLVAELSRSPEELALERKEVGNTFFREHRFSEAHAAYTSALDALPLDVAEQLRADCLGNRAACAQQLHDWDGVIADATQALGIRPDNIKVRIRRATAWEAVENYKGALDDARQVLRVDPRHVQANAIQHRCGRALRELGLSDTQTAPSVARESGEPGGSQQKSGQTSCCDEQSTRTPPDPSPDIRSGSEEASEKDEPHPIGPQTTGEEEHAKLPKDSDAMSESPRVQELSTALSAAQATNELLRQRCLELEGELALAKEETQSIKVASAAEAQRVADQACRVGLERRCAELEEELSSARQQIASMRDSLSVPGKHKADRPELEEQPQSARDDDAVDHRACEQQAGSSSSLSQQCVVSDDKLNGTPREIPAEQANFTPCQCECNGAHVAAPPVLMAPVAQRLAQVVRSSSRREQQMRHLVATMHNTSCRSEKASSAARSRKRVAVAAPCRASERRRQQSERLLEALHAREAGRNDIGGGVQTNAGCTSEQTIHQSEQVLEVEQARGPGEGETTQAGGNSQQAQQIDMLPPCGDAQPKGLSKGDRIGAGEPADVQQDVPISSTAAMEECAAVRRALQASRHERQQLRRAARGFVERFRVRCR